MVYCYYKHAFCKGLLLLVRIRRSIPSLLPGLYLLLFLFADLQRLTVSSVNKMLYKRTAPGGGGVSRPRGGGDRAAAAVPPFPELCGFKRTMSTTSTTTSTCVKCNERVHPSCLIYHEGLADCVCRPSPIADATEIQIRCYKLNMSHIPASLTEALQLRDFCDISNNNWSIGLGHMIRSDANGSSPTLAYTVSSSSSSSQLDNATLVGQQQYQPNTRNSRTCECQLSASNRTSCTLCFERLIRCFLDDLMQTLRIKYDDFDYLLNHTDNAGSDTALSSCDHCRKAYRNWLCRTVLNDVGVVDQAEVAPPTPCDCIAVERLCPYFLPSEDELPPEESPPNDDEEDVEGTFEAGGDPIFKCKFSENDYSNDLQCPHRPGEGIYSPPWHSDCPYCSFTNRCSNPNKCHGCSSSDNSASLSYSSSASSSSSAASSSVVRYKASDPSVISSNVNSDSESTTVEP